MREDSNGSESGSYPDLWSFNSTPRIQMTEYIIKVLFVDDSYWDDGSRWSTREFSFDTYKKSSEFYKKLKESGGFQGKGHGGHKFFQYDEISIFRTETTKLTESEFLQELYIEGNLPGY